MSDIAFAIFASVVLYLAVTHKGFRKVVVWTGAACLLSAMASGFYLWHVHRAKLAAQAADDAIQNARIARADAYDARNSAPAKFDLSKVQSVPIPKGWFAEHAPKPAQSDDWFAQNAPPAAPAQTFSDITPIAPSSGPTSNSAPQYLSTDPNAGTPSTSPSGGSSRVHPADPYAEFGGYAVNYGNATLREDGVLLSCDTLRLRGLSDILASMPDGTRMRVLRFGYEWGAYGNYGAKIQLANGLTGCILDGNTLKLDGE